MTELRYPPPLAAFLDAGGDLVSELGVEAEVLEVACRRSATLDADQRAVEAAERRRWVTRAIGSSRFRRERVADGLPPVDQALVTRAVWSADLLDTPGLAGRVEPLLRHLIPADEWPDEWTA